MNEIDGLTCGGPLRSHYDEVKAEASDIEEIDLFADAHDRSLASEKPNS